MVKNYGGKFLKCPNVNTQCLIPIRFIRTIWCWSLVKRVPKLLAEVTKSLSVILESVSFDSLPNLGNKNHLEALIYKSEFLRNNFRYDATVKATGRYFTEFLESVDNIHHQFSFTYPKMKSPSMYLTVIDENGCVLVYRSSRPGYTPYIMGN